MSASSRCWCVEKALQGNAVVYFVPTFILSGGRIISGVQAQSTMLHVGAVDDGSVLSVLMPASSALPLQQM
jgi:hypothetical protein